MNGVLIVAHGSRAKETEATLDVIVEMVRAKLPDTPIECAFMEFSERTIDKGISSLVGMGVTEIKLVPYFLFSGIHIKEDIPNMAAQCAAQYSTQCADTAQQCAAQRTGSSLRVSLTMGQPLGVDERLADILVDRIVRAPAGA